MQANMNQQQDIRDVIFASVAGKVYFADIVVERAGVLSGVKRMAEQLGTFGLKVKIFRTDGESIAAGRVVATLTGSAKQMAMAEEVAIGIMAKTSGIATAARQAVTLADGDFGIISGAWKKMPPDIKQQVREAVVCGGAAFRICDQPFLYLDKNFARMLGGIAETLAAVRSIQDKKKVIQLKGHEHPVAEEALIAARHGADLMMVDTGQVSDLEAAHHILSQQGYRDQVKLAFAQGIKIEDISLLKGKGIDLLDIGGSIIDAPLLDMKLEVRKGGLSGCS